MELATHCLQPYDGSKVKNRNHGENRRMITYFYWAAVIALAVSMVFVFSRTNWKIGIITALTILVVGWLAYTFHFQQIFVKRLGGVMSISVPKGQHHIAATWKDDNLWIENYDPKSNTCIFTEYSRGNLLQGKVTIKNCDPLLYKSSEPIQQQ
jgi:hypothetical protein